MTLDKTMFEKGEVVVCSGSRGYSLTTGKEYEVIKYDPPLPDSSSVSGFTWPAYVAVIGDNGKELYCHASRFKRKR